MKLEQEIREALHKESREWKAPKSILHEIKQGIQADPIQDRKLVKRRKAYPNLIRKRIIILAAAAIMILPAGAYAGYQYLADSIYGASGNGVTFPGERADYERLEAKLQSARAQLSEAEYVHLEQLLKEGTALLYEFTDGTGDRSTLSAEQLQRLDVLEQEIAAATSAEIPGFWGEILVEAKNSFNEDDYTEFKHLVTHMFAQLQGERKVSNQVYVPLQPYLDRLGYHIETDPNKDFIMWKETD